MAELAVQCLLIAPGRFASGGFGPVYPTTPNRTWVAGLSASNEDRAAKGQDPLVSAHLYTEREPRGQPSESNGHADCGGYIRVYLPEEMGTTYATACRKGEQVEPFSDPREGADTPVQAMEADLQDHLNKVADILKARLADAKEPCVEKT
ncbi:hypothetical protein AB5J49_34460 [Streptomyces sp. R28]|uniref:Uncharacterized protein n=1 Tax=Streptomyces sp. R28 TaxID=3238628 RepID=A0AB39Q9G9_9ACTN